MDTQISAQKSHNQKWGFFGTMIWGVVVLVINGVSAALTLSIYAHVIYGDISIEFINKARSDSTALALCAFASLITGGLVLCGIIKLKKNSNLKEYLAINRASLRQIIGWGLVAFAFLLFVIGVKSTFDCCPYLICYSKKL